MSAIARLSLWEHNREAAMLLLGSGNKPVADDDMLVILDVRDPVARSIAQGVLSGEEMRRQEAIAERGEIPTAIAVLPVPIMRTVLRETSPSVVSSLAATAPEGWIWVACISEGSTMLLSTPREHIPVQGEV